VCGQTGFLEEIDNGLETGFDLISDLIAYICPCVLFMCCYTRTKKKNKKIKKHADVDV